MRKFISVYIENSFLLAHKDRAFKSAVFFIQNKAFTYSFRLRFYFPRISCYFLVPDKNQDADLKASRIRNVVDTKLRIIFYYGALSMTI